MSTRELAPLVESLAFYFFMRVKDIKIGGQYNDFLVQGPQYRKNGSTYYTCKCLRCGKIYDVRSDHIGHSLCCQECRSKDKIKDLSGRRFGRLIALEYFGRSNGRTLWRCLCDCGKESIVGYSALISGNTRSCGCLEKENLHSEEFKRSHRKSASLSFNTNLREHPLYGLWSSMLTRCYNENSIHYKNYGGRGIRVCDRWLPENMGFENFVNDMGPRIDKSYTLDRIDNDGNYCPENCRWATIGQQSNNKRDSIIVFYDEKRIFLTDICRILKLNYCRVAHQLQKGFDINTIIEHGGADFRRKGFKGNTERYKNFNKKITIFVKELENYQHI